MNPTIQQIVTAYEDAAMKPEEIQQELYPDMDLAIIKTTLAQYSSAYQLAVKSSGEALEAVPDITDEEFSMIKRTLKDIALHGESEEVRARCCKYLWEEKKGRNDLAAEKLKALHKAPQINIFMLSKHLEQAKKALERSKQRVIEVSSAQPNEGVLA